MVGMIRRLPDHVSGSVTYTGCELRMRERTTDAYAMHAGKSERADVSNLAIAMHAN